MDIPTATPIESEFLKNHAVSFFKLLIHDDISDEQACKLTIMMRNMLHNDISPDELNNEIIKTLEIIRNKN
tara:strand:+ start:460 stop:672 length:213 start_codon:yes stop_codon:yes gene_type:complete